MCNLSLNVIILRTLFIYLIQNQSLVHKRQSTKMWPLSGIGLFIVYYAMFLKVHEQIMLLISAFEVDLHSSNTCAFKGL